MKILVITNNFPPEKFGNSSRISDLCTHLQKFGNEILVLCPHPTFPIGNFKRKWSLSEHNTINGINVINLFTWQPKTSDPGFLSRMAYYLIFPINTIFWILFNYKKFDIIFTSSPPIFTGFGGIFAKFFNKKWALDVRDLWIEASTSLGFIKKGSLFEKMSILYEKICYSKADLITVTTQRSRDKIQQTYNQINFGNKIHVVPNGVDIDYFYPIAVAKKNQIIYSGNIGYAQDLENVVLAMEKIVQKIDINLLIAGDGDLILNIKKLVQDHELENNVHFMGLVSRDIIPRLISESLIGIAPLKKLETLEYAIPTKCYEYIACNVPFVGCGEGEIRDLAIKSQGGVIAENSPNDIAQKIIQLLENPNQRETLAENGLNYVRKYCTRKQIAFDLHNIFSQM